MRRVISVNCVAILLILMVAAVGAPAVEPSRSGLFLPVHSRITLSGQTLGSRPGHHMKGHVFATAHWNDGARYVVATPRTDSLGRWQVTFSPSHRGLYKLRILTPDAAVLEYTFDVR